LYVLIVEKAILRFHISALGSELVHLLPKTELLNGEIFYTLKEAQIVIENWRRHYNRASQHPSFYVIEENRLC
jgi:hypothetical protein